MLPFTKDELTGIVRWAMQQAGADTYGESFAQAVAQLMYDTMITLDSDGS